MSVLTPTDEQAAAVAAFGSGENVILEAGAGTGKTWTLRLMAGAPVRRRRGLYLAFNRATQADARKVGPVNKRFAVWVWTTPV